MRLSWEKLFVFSLATRPGHLCCPYVMQRSSQENPQTQTPLTAETCSSFCTFFKGNSAYPKRRRKSKTWVDAATLALCSKTLSPTDRVITRRHILFFSRPNARGLSHPDPRTRVWREAGNHPLFLPHERRCLNSSRHRRSLPTHNQGCTAVETPWLRFR